MRAFDMPLSPLLLCANVEKKNASIHLEFFFDFPHAVVSDGSVHKESTNRKENKYPDEDIEQNLTCHSIFSCTNGYFFAFQRRMPPSRFTALKPLSTRSLAAFPLRLPERQ